MERSHDGNAPLREAPLRAPDFHRLRTTLLNGKAGAVPLLELFYDLEVMDAFMGHEVNTSAQAVEFYYLAGYDYVPVAFVMEGRTALGPEEEARRVKALRSERATRQQYTKAESARGEILTLDDYYAHDWPPLAGPVDFSYFDSLAGQLPPAMKAIAWTNGIYETVSQAMGYQHFCYSLYDNPELIRRMFETVGALKVDRFRRLAQKEVVGALWLADDLGYTEGLLWSAEAMRKYLFPWYHELGRVARRYDKPLIFHSDGRLWEIMDDLVAAGFNALQPIEPKAWNPREVRARYGDRLAIAGTIDLDLLARGTPAEVEALVREHIETLSAEGGFCVGTSNTPAYYIDIGNLRAMLDAAVKYGGRRRLAADGGAAPFLL